MDNINLNAVILAAGVLAACTNPALSDSAVDMTALDRLGETACRVAERPTASLPEQSRGLYTQAVALSDASRGSTDYSRDAEGCTLQQGSYALQVELDVYTQEDQSAVTAQYDPTRDRATLLLRADLDGSDQASLRLCGLELPTRYAYATSTATQLRVPEEVWDRDSMPIWRSSVHASKKQLQLDAFPLLLGVALSEPGVKWPSYEETPTLECGAGRSGVTCFPDHDGDGQPGLTFAAHSGGEVSDAPYPACHAWSYAPPSTQPEPWLSDDPSQSAGAARAFVGLRTALQLLFDFDEDCSEATGSVVAEDVVTRTFDCELKSGLRCTPYQATALDARAPTYHVLAKRETPPPSFHDSRNFIDEALDRASSDGGKVAARRLAASTSCTAVRAAFAR